MKTKAIIILALLTTAACGSGSGSGSGRISTPKSGITGFNLTAYIAEPGDVQTNAQAQMAASALVTVPASGSSLSNSSENTRATLIFGSVAQCYYNHVANTNTYDLTGCTSSLAAGDTVIVPTNEIVTLQLETGYATADTSVSFDISAQ